MSDSKWYPEAFPASFNLAGNTKFGPSSPGDLFTFATKEGEIQRSIASKAVFSPSAALEKNQHILAGIIMTLDQVARGRATGSMNLMETMKANLSRFIPSYSQPFELLQSPDTLDQIEGGVLIARHFGVDWIDPVRGWDFTRDEFDRAKWAYPARSIELELAVKRLQSQVLETTQASEKIRLTADSLGKSDVRIDLKLAEYDQTWVDLLATGESRLKALEETYRVGKEYGEAVKYWRNKRWVHTGTKYAALLVLAALLVKPILMFVSVAPDLQPFLDGLATKNDHTLVPLAVILSFVAFCYVSAVRFLTRFYADHHADGEDAHLRETLIKTYLAMRKDDQQPLSESERLLALHALFRGSSRAPTADDTPPVNTLEALINTLKPAGGKS